MSAFSSEFSSAFNGNAEDEQRPFEVSEGTAVLMVGGPEDGRVVVGQEAFGYIAHGETPKDPEEGSRGTWIFKESKIGRRIMVLNSRWAQAANILGMDRTNKAYHEHGINHDSGKYELVAIEDGLYVYRYFDKA